MISQISGKIVRTYDEKIIVQVNNIGYELLAPRDVVKFSQNHLNEEKEFYVYSFIQNFGMGGGKMVLIGFLNEIDKEFFEKLISVSGIGPKAAVKALSLPTKQIAEAIERQDVRTLTKLPGIGGRMAEKIVAELKGKLYPILLAKYEVVVPSAEASEEYIQEAMAILSQLGYSDKEAKAMIDMTVEQHPDITSAEELIKEVYGTLRKHRDNG